MYLHFSETTNKTILGTILRNQSKFFPYIQYLAYLQPIFTSVINLFKNIPIPDFSILDMFLYFQGYSEFALTISIPLVEVLQISLCHAQNVFFPYVFSSSQNYDLN